MTEYERYEDYINSPELAESKELLFAYGVFVQIKTDDATEKYPEVNYISPFMIALQDLLNTRGINLLIYVIIGCFIYLKCIM